MVPPRLARAVPVLAVSLRLRLVEVRKRGGGGRQGPRERHVVVRGRLAAHLGVRDLAPGVVGRAVRALQLERDVGAAGLAADLGEHALQALELLEQDAAARLVERGEQQDEVEDEEVVFDAEGGFLEGGGGHVDQDVGDGVGDFEELLRHGGAVDFDVVPRHFGYLVA